METTYKDHIRQAVLELMGEEASKPDEKSLEQMIDCTAEKIYQQCVKELEEKLARLQENTRTLFNESYRVIHEQTQQLEQMASEREVLLETLAEIKSRRDKDIQKLNGAEQQAIFWKQDAEFWSDECRKVSQQVEG